MAEPIGNDWDWELIRNRCLREALRIVRRADDAEDIVQEAITRAWKSRMNCRTPDAPIGWCLQITRNEALRLITNQNARPSDAWPADELDQRVDERALGEADRVLIRVDTRRALAELTPQQRLLLALRHHYGYTHPEIAAKLQIPEATARVRLYRAHQRLRPMLTDDI
jgi:RNA polymerase sigma-70 factor (ECF subfamily)